MKIKNFVLMGILTVAPLWASEDDSLSSTPKAATASQQKLSPQEQELFNTIEQLLKSSNHDEKKLGEYLLDPRDKPTPKLWSLLKELHFDLLSKGKIEWTGPTESRNAVEKVLSENYSAPKKEAAQLRIGVIVPAKEKIKTDMNVRVTCALVDLLWKYKMKGGFSSFQGSSTGPDSSEIAHIISEWNSQEDAAVFNRSIVETRFAQIEWTKRLFNIVKSRWLFPRLRETKYAPYEPVAGLLLNRATEHLEKKVTPSDQDIMSNAALRGKKSALGDIFDASVDLYGSYEGHSKLVADTNKSLLSAMADRKRLLEEAETAKQRIMERSDSQILPHLNALLNHAQSLRTTQKK